MIPPPCSNASRGTKSAACLEQPSPERVCTRNALHQRPIFPGLAMFDDEDDDEHGTFGMLMGLTLFLIVSGLLIGSIVTPAAQSKTSLYSQSYR